MPGKVVLFVCTGNVCRSPMAEYLLRHRLGPDSGWTIRSAGISATDGMRASLAAFKALREFGIDMSDHTSRALTRTLVNEAELIVVMTSEHRDEIRRRFPDVMDKVRLVTSFGSGVRGEGIIDPIGMSVDVYSRVRDEIDSALPGLMEHLKRVECDGNTRERSDS
jgi:protein-tyrosine-phosphatase